MNKEINSQFLYACYHYYLETMKRILINHNLSKATLRDALFIFHNKNYFNAYHNLVYYYLSSRKHKLQIHIEYAKSIKDKQLIIKALNAYEKYKNNSNI